jgi:N-acetylglucosaminyldiphosphoundecaprenol N-acetyl-beta-D-mannosaminyltransferase
MKKHECVLGVQFFSGNVAEAVNIALGGGLVVAPSAPVLIDIWNNHQQREALLNADLVIADSGLMVLTWRILTGEKVSRISGLEYLKKLLETPQVKADSNIAWIMPNQAAKDINLKWANSAGLQCSSANCYVAPIYPNGEIFDFDIIAWLENRRPKQIIIGLGGGTQERLGRFLIKTLSYRPSIHCIGAAIGFLNGDQIRIPMWADRIYVGWLLRCLSNPVRFGSRYLRAIKLIPMLYSYKKNRK